MCLGFNSLFLFFPCINLFLCCPFICSCFVLFCFTGSRVLLQFILFGLLFPLTYLFWSISQAHVSMNYFPKPKNSLWNISCKVKCLDLPLDSIQQSKVLWVANKSLILKFLLYLEQRLWDLLSWEIMIIRLCGDTLRKTSPVLKYLILVAQPSHKINHCINTVFRKRNWVITYLK